MGAVCYGELMDSHDLVNICASCCVAGEEEEVMSFRLKGLIISARNDYFLLALAHAYLFSPK